MDASNDDAESVDAFLERIASLKDKREREDEARTKKLEEEILQGRRERQARRAERTRSLSPQKTSRPEISPSSAPHPFHHDSNSEHVPEPAVKPPLQSHTIDRSVQSEATKTFAQGSPGALPLSPGRSSAPSNTTSTALARSGTLSWQQRPSSKDSNASRARPLSLHTEKSASAAAHRVEEGRTRDQIALSLGSKDPSWFRQIADRGVGSPAYRKSREEGHENAGQGSSVLPGTSRDSSAEPGKAPISLPTKDRSRSPSQASSAADTSSWGNRFSSVSSQSTLGAPKTSPNMKSLQKSGLPPEGLEVEQPAAKSLGMPSLQRQHSVDRPASPTKGLGGFVQSAMMKRSDSVNKRWSAQAAPGLTRGNSVASYRGGLGYPGSTMSGPESPPREPNGSPGGSASSPLWKSRPSSSHSTSAVPQQAMRAARSSFQGSSPKGAASVSPNPGPSHDTLLNETSPREQGLKQSVPVLLPAEVLPASPTKTMDPKRWSPTKASWLESALAKPESPKLASPVLQTPGWMADLQKSKLSKDESEPFNTSTPAYVSASPTMLMRSPPPGGYAKPSSISGHAEGFSSGPTSKSSLKNAQETTTVDRLPPQHNSFTNADAPPASTVVPPSDHPGSSGPKDLPNAGEREEIPGPAGTEEGKKKFPLTSKLDTPPKIDFRASLRQRKNIPEENSSLQPEFKNVFAKLKRTDTKNYVAPDELKDNILRGKAALSLTGGPQRTKRHDEFKESIIKRKESMKSEGGLTRKIVAEPDPTEKTAANSATLPEALAKRDRLNSHANSSMASAADAVREVISGTNRPSVALRASEQSAVSLEDNPGPSKTAAGRPELVSETASPYTSEPQKPAVSNVRQVLSNHRENSPVRHKQEITSSPASCDKQGPTAEETNEERTEYKPVGKLASRINPSLAAILSHGPALGTNTRIASDGETSSNYNGPRLTVKEEKAPSGSSLTHVTKARARGPKRRLPQTVTHADQLEDASDQSNQVNVPKETVERTHSRKLSNDALSQDLTFSDRKQDASIAAGALVGVINDNNDDIAQPDPPKKQPILPHTAEQSAQERGSECLLNTDVKEKEKPTVAQKAPDLRRVTPPVSSRGVAIATESDPESFPLPRQLSHLARRDGQTEQKKIGKLAGDVSQPTDMTLRTSSTSSSSALRPQAAATPAKNSPELRPNSESRSIPVALRRPMPSGLGLNLEPEKIRPPESQLTPPPEEKCSEKLCSDGTMGQVEGKKSCKAQEQTTRQQGDSEAAGLLADFFDEKLKMTDKAEVDTQSVILERPSADSKSKVLKTQLSQINADGRKERLPPHQEHILFEDCMYLCVCSFERSSGSAATEVYLWCGDDVNEAATEDVQLFCRKEAREHNAKLEMLRQGSEPAKFFQALGGIVITRRSRTSALYMLRGRRHLGHVAFDEVDLDAASLCSGFPYLISAGFGKPYLWKGKGSGADEVGCARLIGMDLGLAGEIEEVEEGAEPTSFVDLFGGAVKAQISSPLWNLRSSYDRCAPRLFRVELERSRGMSGFWTRRGSSPAKPSKAIVQEIHPFGQRDLDSRCIFVLDGYFIIFVYVGDEACSKSAEFVTALVFAQEYGIIAASVEDRPSIPACHVIFGDPPPDFTVSFRKWQRHPGYQTRQNKSRKVIALHDAIESIDS